MNVFELCASLTLDTSGYEEGLNNARRQAESSGSKIGSVLKDGMKVAGAAFTAAGAAVAGFSKMAVDASIDYESAFTGVTKTVEETATTSYDMLSDAIMRMATETASSKEVIAGVMEAAGQLGISADDIVGFTETMIQLGDTTNLSAEEAAIALARFTNITGLASGDVDKLGSAIVDLGNNFATDEASIVSMSTRLASAGTIAGLSSTDILALSTAMSSVGIEAEAGGTAMTQVLTKIGNAVANGVDPSNEKLKAFAEVAGMSAESFAEAWNTSPVEALSQFIIGLDKLNTSGENVNAVLEDLNIRGVRESNMIKSLALASDVLTAAVDTASTAFLENSALSEEANKRYGTMESQISQLKEAYSNMKVTIGDELLPTLSNFIEYGKTGMTELTTAFQQGGLTGALESLGPIIDQGVEMLFDVLPRVMEAGAALLDAFVTAVITNLPKLVPAAVQLIQTLVQNIVENLPQLLDAATEIIGALTDGLIQVLPDLIPAIVQIVTQIVDKLTEPETLQAIFAAGEQILHALAEGLVKAFPVLSAIGTDGVEAILAGVAGALAAGKVIATVTQFITLFKGIATAITAAGGLIPALGALISPIGLVVAAIGAAIAIGVLLYRNWDEIKEKASQIWNSVKDTVSSAVDSIKNAVSSVAESGKQMIEGFADGIKESASAVWDSIKEVVSGIWDTIAETIQAAKEWGSDLLQNFMGGVVSKGAALLEKVKGVAQSIRNLIGFSEPKEGPLAKFHTFAPDMMELFAKGIKDNEHLVTGQIEKSFDFSGNVIGNAAPALTAGPTTTTNTWNITVNGIEELDEIIHWYQSRQVIARMA